MKKLLAVFLCVCMTLAVCGAAFAAGGTGSKADKAELEKLSDAVDPEAVGAVLSILSRIAEFNDEREFVENAGVVDFLEWLGISDAIESEVFTDAVVEDFKNLYNAAGKYEKGELTEKNLEELLDYALTHSDDISDLGDEAFGGADEDGLFTLEDISRIFEELELDELIDEEDYEDAFFGLLYLFRLIGIYYSELVDAVDAADVIYALYWMSALYEAGWLEDLSMDEIEEAVKELGLEDVLEYLLGSGEVAAKAKAVSKQFSLRFDKSGLPNDLGLQSAKDSSHKAGDTVQFEVLKDWGGPRGILNVYANGKWLTSVNCADYDQGAYPARFTMPAEDSVITFSYEPSPDDGKEAGKSGSGLEYSFDFQNSDVNEALCDEYLYRLLTDSSLSFETFIKEYAAYSEPSVGGSDIDTAGLTECASGPGAVSGGSAHIHSVGPGTYDVSYGFDTLSVY